MKKKILILISSLLSALVLFFCISFNTNVYAYETDQFSYTLESNSINYTTINNRYGFIASYNTNYAFTLKDNSSFTDGDYFMFNYFVIDTQSNNVVSWSDPWNYQIIANNRTSYMSFNMTTNEFNNNGFYTAINKIQIFTFATSLVFKQTTNYSNRALFIFNIDVVKPYDIGLEQYYQTYYGVIEDNYNQLLADYNDLQGDYDDLDNDYSTLQTSYSELESQYNSLQANYNTLQANYNDLVSNYGEMFQQYQDLQSEFEALSNAVDEIKRYSYLYYLFNDVPVYTLANIDWHDVQYNYYRTDVTSAKQLIDTLDTNYTYTQDSGYWYYDKIDLNDDSQKILFYDNIPNNLPILKTDSNFVDLLSSDVAYYFDISKLGYKGFIEMLFDISNWSGQVLYNYTIQVLYSNNNVVTYDLSSYLTDNEISLQSTDDYFSLGFELSPSAIGLYIKCNDNGDFFPNSLYVATDTWYYNSGFSAGVQSQAVTISQLSERITDLNDVIVTLRKTIQNKDDQISNNFGWQQFFGGMADIPFLTIFNFMNVDILGFNLFHMFAGIITAIAMLWLIKRLYK